MHATHAAPFAGPVGAERPIRERRVDPTVCLTEVRDEVILNIKASHAPLLESLPESVCDPCRRGSRARGVRRRSRHHIGHELGGLLLLLLLLLLLGGGGGGGGGGGCATQGRRG